jgi:hypothetical protein
MTLNAAHSGLAAEDTRHEKLRVKFFFSGMMDAVEWRHHETEHNAAVARWRSVAQMAQRTADHHDVTHQLIASKQRVAAAAANARRRRRRRKEGDESGGEGGEGVSGVPNSNLVKRVKREAAENERLSESVLVLVAKVKASDVELKKRERERERTLELLRSCEDRVMEMVVERDEMVVVTESLAFENEELREIMREKKGVRDHHERHMSTMDSFLITPRRRRSKGGGDVGEQKELPRRLHSMLPAASFVMKKEEEKKSRNLASKKKV